MALDNEAILQQRALLFEYRRRLNHLVRQRARMGDHVPPYVLTDIQEAQASISAIKSTLRDAQVDVEDSQLDDAPLALAPRDTVLPASVRNRHRLLNNMRGYWLAGVLDPSIQDASLITLRLTYQLNAVEQRLANIAQEGASGARAIAPNASIVELFDKLGGELLILGEPGAGKTTLLLELTRELLERAEVDTNHPIPVIFNLSTWARRTRSIKEWLVLELNEYYKVSQTVARIWVDDNQLLLLLDGLDEVAQEQQQECVLALNAFMRDHGLMQMVVCSRTINYDLLSKKLELRHAIRIEPLTPQQADAYLASAGDKVASLRAAMATHEALGKLGQNPLMLHMMAQTYKVLPLEALPTSSQADELIRHLFESYVARMFQRRSATLRYTPQQTQHWLGNLARWMEQTKSPMFLIERLQPDCLTTRTLRRQYAVIDRCLGALGGGLFTTLGYGLLFANPFVGLLCGLFGAIIGGLFGGNEVAVDAPRGLQRSIRNAFLGGALSALVGVIVVLAVLAPLLLLSVLVGYFFKPEYFFKLAQEFSALLGIDTNTGTVLFVVFFIISLVGIIIELAFGLAFVGALVGTIVGAPTIQLRRIVIVESLHWSWRKAVRSAQRGFISWSLMMLIPTGVFAIIVGIATAQRSGMGQGALEGISTLLGSMLLEVLIAMLGGILAGLLNGLVGDEIAIKAQPNQGIRRSVRTAAISALRIGLTISTIFGLITIIIYFIGVLILAASAYLYAPQLMQQLSPVRVTGDMLLSELIAELPSLLISVLRTGFTIGVSLGLFGALLSSLLNGGYACISHLALRIVLWRNRLGPWNYAGFLDYAVERVLLRRVGGGYMFLHRLLQEYFASISASK
jgi:DNA polymerase III delta prime subunit